MEFPFRNGLFKGLFAIIFITGLLGYTIALPLALPLRSKYQTFTSTSIASPPLNSVLLRTADLSHLIESETMESSFQFPNWRTFTLGILTVTVTTCVSALLCCLKKRSGSYGTDGNHFDQVPIFRLKGQNDSGLGSGSSGPRKIEPESRTTVQIRTTSAPSQTANLTPISQSKPQESQTSSSPSAVVVPIKPARAAAAASGNRNDYVTITKTISKGDISPPIRVQHVQELPSEQRTKLAGTESPFLNPDPEKEPLKPFTYSPIPPLKIKAGEIPVHKIKQQSATYAREQSGHPFSNPDPMKEPLKPFTYSPIPIRLRKDLEDDSD